MTLEEQNTELRNALAALVNVIDEGMRMEIEQIPQEQLDKLKVTREQVMALNRTMDPPEMIEARRLLCAS